MHAPNPVCFPRGVPTSRRIITLNHHPLPGRRQCVLRPLPPLPRTNPDYARINRHDTGQHADLLYLQRWRMRPHPTRRRPGPVPALPQHLNGKELARCLEDVAPHHHPRPLHLCQADRVRVSCRLDFPLVLAVRMRRSAPCHPSPLSVCRPFTPLTPH